MPFSLRTMLLIAAVLQVVWGLVPSASKIVIDEIPVELYIALRWTISGLLLLTFLLLRTRWLPPLRKDTVLVALLGIGGYAIGSLGTLYSLKIGGVANFALMAALSPIITSLTSILLLKERPSRLFFYALAVCVAGLALLVAGKQELSSWHVALTSAALAIGADVLEAVIFVYSKKMKERFTSLQYMVIAQLAAAGFFWCLQLGYFHQWAELAKLSAQGWASAIFVSVVACCFCYALLYWLLTHLEGHRLALFDGLHTLSATLFGVLFFQETLNAPMLAGGTLLLGGLVLGNWKAAPRP